MYWIWFSFVSFTKVRKLHLCRSQCGLCQWTEMVLNNVIFSLLKLIQIPAKVKLGLGYNSVMQQNFYWFFYYKEEICWRLKPEVHSLFFTTDNWPIQLKTHQKKFELDRSRNGRVIENSKNVRLGGWWVLVGYKQLLTKSLLTNFVRVRQ